MERMNVEYIGDLEAFEAVCKEGNFAKAAKKTRSSLSSVSKRISRLERSLHAILFERSTRSIRITEAGQNFLIRTERILSELREAEKESSREKELKGRIRIAAALPFATGFLPELLSEFGNLFSEIIIDLIFENEKPNLISDKYDLALRIMKPMSSSRCIKLLPNPLVACANPGYLDRTGIPTRIDDMVSHKLLFVEEHANLKIGRKRLAELSQERQIKSNNGSFLSEYVANGGNGILFRSYWDVEPHLRSGRLRRIFPQNSWDTGTMGCLLLPGSSHPKRVSRLCEFLQDRVPIRFPELGKI